VQPLRCSPPHRSDPHRLSLRVGARPPRPVLAPRPAAPAAPAAPRSLTSASSSCASGSAPHQSRQSKHAFVFARSLSLAGYDHFVAEGGAAAEAAGGLKPTGARGGVAAVWEVPREQVAQL